MNQARASFKSRDENVHHVREVLDEVFGKKNCCGLITFVKTSAQDLNSAYCDSSERLPAQY